MVCGIYLFGSALVYIALVWNGPTYPLKLALPPLIGIGFSIIYPIWLMKKMDISGLIPSNVHLQKAVNRVRMDEAAS